MSDAWLLRLGILVAGVILIAAIYFFGKPRRQGQGRRVGPGERGSRTEPTLGAQIESELAEAQETGGEAVVQAEMELLDRAVGSTAAMAASEVGKRENDDFDKIVTLYIARSEEHTSELQSLMRNSYAGFCLKKTKKIRK